MNKLQLNTAPVNEIKIENKFNEKFNQLARLNNLTYEKANEIWCSIAILEKKDDQKNLINDICNQITKTKEMIENLKKQMI
jgi:hypothetical protein